jgi:DNA-directed RNA polymerase specialized sigma24 family protein
LFRIAANALADRWRRASRDSYELPTDVPDGREAEETERRAMLFQLVERLPDTPRRVIET